MIFVRASLVQQWRIRWRMWRHNRETIVQSFRYKNKPAGFGDELSPVYSCTFGSLQSLVLISELYRLEHFAQIGQRRVILERIAAGIRNW